MAIQELYLHIGRGKTGTTAIQRFLSTHRESLRARGVHYVEADDTAQMGHQNFAKSFIKQPPSYMEMPPNLERSREAVRSELVNSASNIALISSENLTLVDLSELAKFVRRALGPVGVKIIFFARSQDELAESQYNQMVKLARCAKTFEEYVEHELDELDFAALLIPWAGQFGSDNVIARVFNAAGNRLIEDFLACLPLSGNDPDWQKDAPIHNPSVGYLAGELFRSLNRFEFPKQRKLYEQLNEIIKPVDLPPVYFNSAGARAFRHRFQASNEVFLRQYLGRDGDDLGGRKFSDEERDRIFEQIKALQRNRQL